MIQYRRLAALVMGLWLGGAVVTDVAVIQNFQSVDRFLSARGDVAVSTALNAVGRDIGRDGERFLLRRNAADENAWIFTNWERVELALGGLLFLLLLFGDRPQKLLLGLCAAMFVAVAVEHFFLTPAIIDLGRKVDEVPAGDPLSGKFWMFHGIYSGLDILKMLVGAVFALRISIRRKPDADHFVREYAASLPVEGKVRRG